MKNRISILAATLTMALAGSAWGQAASAPAPASPAKKELVQRVLKLQQPGIEAMGRSLAEEPAARLLQQAGMAMQQVPADKREAVAKDIQADVKKYADEAVPLVRDRAVKLSASVLGPMFESTFSEDELKTLLAWMESPVSKKYQQLAPEMQKALSEKVVSETRPAIEAKIQALQQSIGKRLGAPAPAAPASGAKKK